MGGPLSRIRSPQSRIPLRSVLLLFCLAAALLADEPTLKTFGQVTLFHLSVAVPTASPVRDLRAIDFRNFKHVVYPIAEAGANLPLSGDRPLVFSVADGIYDHRSDADAVEFDVTRSELVDLPKAPGGKAVLIYAVLYNGGDAEQCTGIVQIMENASGKLMLMDQITYNCRGGASATFDIHKHQLIVESAHFAAGDKPCCPSMTDRVRFKLDGEHAHGSQVDE